MEMDLKKYQYLFRLININKIIFILILFLNYSVVNSAIRYVKYDASGANNGTSWANAYTSFQSALNVATSGDEIWVARGTYKPSSDYALGGGTRYYHFRMINGVAIYGGFAGSETATSQRTTYGEGQANETILSGDLNGDDAANFVNRTDNVYHIFYHPSGVNLTSSAILNGFTLSGAYANGGSPHNSGGGIYNNTNSPTILNCFFYSNYSSYGGSGFYNISSSNDLSNCKFKTNNSGSRGASIFFEFCTNSTVDNCSFTDNNSSMGGVLQVEFSSNTTMKNCIAYSNTGQSGLIHYYSSSNNTVTNCLVYENTGWIFRLENCDITLNNVTVTSNTASSSGASFHLQSQPCTVTINNSILSNNTSGKPEIYLNASNSTININYSCITNSTLYENEASRTGNVVNSSNNNTTSDPLFKNAANDDYRLSKINNSPCIDAGNNAYIAETYDYRGSPYDRKLNKTNGNTGTVDMGAYEFKAGYDGVKITTESVSYSTGNSANASISYLNTSAPTITAIGIVWGTLSQPTVSLSTKTIDSPSSNLFNTTLSNLEYGTTYYVRAYVTNSQGTEYGDEISFTTLTLSQIVENSGPNGGDGNNDGIADSQQDKVITIYNNYTNKYITIESLDGYTITGAEIQSPNDNINYYPASLVKFTIAHSSASVKIYYHGVTTLSGYSFKKLNSQNILFNFTNYTFGSEVINGKTVATATLTLTDGGPEDYDGLVNGSITDPGGPAILATDANIPVWDWRWLSLLILLISMSLHKYKVT